MDRTKRAGDPESLRHVLTVRGPCNNRCEVCDAPVGAPAPPRLPPMKPGDRLWITGAEPTLCPSIFDLIAKASRDKVAVRLFTNGRVFFYPQNAPRAAGAGLSEAMVALHGADAATHDGFTRSAGSFDQTVEGARNLSRAGVRVTVRAPVRPGAHALPGLVDLAAAVGAEAVLYEVSPPEASVAERLRDLDDVRRAGRRAPGGVAVLVDYCGMTTDLSRSADVLEHNVDPATGDVSAAPRNWCTNQCVFCVAKNLARRYGRPMPLDTPDSLAAALDAIARTTRRRGRFEFSTIEPAESPFLLEMADMTRRAGFGSLGIWTHGRTLADRYVARELVGAGFRAFRIPLLGHTAAVHDAVAGGRGAFDETVAGIANLRSLGVREIALCGMVVEQNAAHTLDLMRFARERFEVDVLPMIEAQPTTVDPADYARYAFRVGALAHVVEPCGRAIARAFAFVQPCVFARPDDLFAAGSGEPVRGHGALTWNRGGREHKEKRPCPKRARCRWAGQCPGINTQYGALFGYGEFRPGSRRAAGRPPISSRARTGRTCRP